MCDSNNNMVETKIFSATVEPSSEVSPPLVPVQAVDPPPPMWHLEAVPIPSAPSFLYDEHLFSERIPTTVITNQNESAEEPSLVMVEDESDHPEGRVTRGAGVASGVIGLLLGGPFLGLLFGFGAAYAATRRDDAWGDSARALGHVALTAQAQARVVDEKHHVVERSRRAARRALRRARELDRKHDLWNKTTRALRASWKSTRDFVRKHRLVERSVEGVGMAIAWTVEQIEQKIKESQHRVEQEPRRANHPH